MDKQTYLYNADFVDELYESFLQDPASVSAEWQQHFAKLQQEQPISRPEVLHRPIQERYTNYKPSYGGGTCSSEVLAQFASKQAAVLRLINAYRYRGHQRADLDPLKMQERPPVEDLDPASHGLTEADMNIEFDTGSLYGLAKAKLRDIIALLKKVYCGTIGAEYMHMTDTVHKRWIQERLEGAKGEIKLDAATKSQILERLTAAQGLEDYLHTQYVGQKRFSLEGGESLIPMLDEMIQRAGAKHGVDEIVVGMAHRGRLNVLVNVLGKRPQDLFSEFEGKKLPKGAGDVKYHQGYSSDVDVGSGHKVHLALAFNPSHLEIINPVVIGSVRARQERRDNNKDKVMPILIHGDAAFAGQGVNMETFNMAETRGYGIGGTMHIVVNNQIGFTTSDPLDSRSALYCTEVAKMAQAPIFHVNGDDPEAVLFVTQIALDFRMQFHRDAVIDLVCYRRHGHNEADEPAATQPIMYQKINKQVKTQALYAQKLAKEGLASADASETMLQQYRAALKTKDVVSRPISMDFKHAVDWRPYIDIHWTQAADTTLAADKLRDIMLRVNSVPEGFKLHRTVDKIVEARRQMGRGEAPFDWGGAEQLAFASLLEEGHPVRLSGQDCGRGTFAHRHAVLHHQGTGETYVPLRHLSDKQANFLVINSTLSEEAVLGFEYGYNSSAPDELVIWEGQFGDFANGAQVVIDQFLSSSETKWQRLCGLTMLLPHGYDGQGPEHSSARLERYLQLCAEDNIQVCCPTTPAQLFHMLRRQIVRPYRKPLIVMSPKSMLRHKRVISTIDDFTKGGFKPVIDEVDSSINPEKVNRLLFCTGKVYYDLLEAREEHGIDDVAIVRLEQLYPYPKQAIAEVLARYTHVKHRLWVQEEPRNQGAWWYIRAHMDVELGHKDQHIEYAGRPACASPAVGYLQVHRQQLQEFLTHALELDVRSKKAKKSA